jgi:type IV pilus assembly protein PilB
MTNPALNQNQPVDPVAKPSNLLDALRKKQLLTEDQANQISFEQISTGKKVEEIILQKNFASEEAVTRAKAEIHGIPFIKIAEAGTDPQALTQLPEGVARSYGILPLSYNKQENLLTVVMKDPLDLAAIDFAEQKSGMRLVTNYAMPSEVERAIAEHYSQSLSSEVTAALEQSSQMSEVRQKKNNLSSLNEETIREAPITKIVQTVVSFAMKARASDIHIEPQEGRTRVRYRIDGILSEKLILPATVHDAVVSRVKILSGLKIDEKRIPQDGRFNFVADEEEVDLRVSTLPTIHGEKIVMRLLKKDATVPDLPSLGITGVALRHVKDSIKVPHGIVLVTGPTGSGKTTTLYSVLHTINSPKVNIMTLEDPVEYQMMGINQVQINPQAGLSFASGLRSFLRQDPNIIMVGEIRDSETSDLAIQAALTGHLVFSTLHTSSAAGALPRLLDMGAEPFLLASSMTLVMAQRVVRIINPDYKEEYKPEPAVMEDIKKVLGPYFDNWCKQNNKNPDEIVLYRPKAERPATEPEYKGRIGIFEVMKISEEIGKLILERKPASELEKLAMKDGMLLMKQDGYLKVLDGITSIEEILRVAQI